MWNKINELFAHPQIQIALALGIGIIAQAYVYKKIYHIEVEGIFILLPGLVVLVYETMIHKKENKDKKYMKPIYWITVIILANIISLLIPLINE
ncbi:MAG: hypothetical protein GY865_03765 [candidate division Zixibacteria bacterium]|nr:hypothetical protein [candidate division Zixibacteria bacterium]